MDNFKEIDNNENQKSVTVASLFRGEFNENFINDPNLKQYSKRTILTLIISLFIFYVALITITKIKNENIDKIVLTLVSIIIGFAINHFLKWLTIDIDIEDKTNKKIKEIIKQFGDTYLATTVVLPSLLSLISNFTPFYYSISGIIIVSILLYIFCKINSFNNKK